MCRANYPSPWHESRPLDSVLTGGSHTQGGQEVSARQCDGTGTTLMPLSAPFSTFQVTVPMYPPPIFVPSGPEPATKGA
jgi:hypothetical protein